jgi:peptidoglycan/xylan/chitin deacetylase (PgdA/CDA1 family)
VRARAIGALRGDQLAGLAEHPSAERDVPDVLLPATWQEVRAAAGTGVTIGSHTVSHRNLAALDAEGIREELERARAEIGAALGTPPSEVSYPYGLHNETVLAAARRAGYSAGATMKFGLATRNADPLALPRINVPAGISVPALECWAAGIRLRGAS